VKIQFIASVSAIVRDTDAARTFYGDGLGLSFEGGQGDYVFTQELPGTKHFGLWPLREAALACFGTEEWPTDVPVPHAAIEFEVEDVAAAAHELQQRGLHLIHEAKTEPWTQGDRPAAQSRWLADRHLLHAMVPRQRAALALAASRVLDDPEHDRR
jgi:catechol 2,3-dioxygenase-like lactoylglutathione lyase family enzyme